MQIKPCPCSQMIQFFSKRVDQSLMLGIHQQTDDPHDSYAQMACNLPPQLFIHQQQIHLSFHGQDNGFRFACIQLLQQCLYQRTIVNRVPLNPGCLFDLCSPWFPFSPYNHFLPNSLGQNHLIIEGREERKSADAAQIDQRGCIANNNHNRPSSFNVFKSSS